jgi:histidine ammonia-lyase
LLCTAQGFDFRKPLKSTRFLNHCHDFIRSEIQFADADRYFYEDMKRAIRMIRDKELIQIINKEAGDEFTNEKHEIFGIY